MTGITIATARGRIATKQILKTPEGLRFFDYPLERYWLFRSVQTPHCARGWAAFLNERVEDRTSLYGEPIHVLSGYQRRLIHAAENAPATLREVPRDYLFLDIDSVPTPHGFDFLADPIGATAAIIDGCESLQGVAFACVISGSAGFKPGVRAKVVIPLSEAWLPSAFRLWAKALNLRLGLKVFDPAISAPAQPIYVARPILHGLADPFTTRVGIRHGMEPLSLVMPTGPAKAPTVSVTPRPEIASTSIGGAGGLRTHLRQLGRGGFHDVLLAAAGAVVRQYCGAPSEPLASIIHRNVEAAVLAADPGHRSEREIDRYASRAFWDDLIRHAARCEQRLFNRILITTSGIKISR